MAVLIRQFILAIAVLLMVSGSAFAASGGLQLYEQEIKAGLLYNFLKYTQWPQDKQARDASSIAVCIFGDDPFGGSLQPMAGRTVQQKAITIRRIHKIEEIDGCHMLFLNADESDQWPKLKNATSKKNVLTVSDYAGFVQSGGMIEFGKKGDHISVALNIDAVLNARLQVQSRLLKLVTVYQGGGQ